MKNYLSLIEALDDLRKRGYVADFATQTVCLYCGDLDMRLDPEDFQVDEIYRFDDKSAADEKTVLYAISSSYGVKGTLVDGFGPFVSNMGTGMARKLEPTPGHV